jgi:hypothetical protein
MIRSVSPLPYNLGSPYLVKHGSWGEYISAGHVLPDLALIFNVYCPVKFTSKFWRLDQFLQPRITILPNHENFYVNLVDREN